MAYAASGCGGDTAGPETGIDVEDVTSDENAGAVNRGPGTLGDTVTISAEVADVFSPVAFSLPVPGLSDELLVVAEPGDALVEEGDVVMVTGTIREFEYGVGNAAWADADFDQFRERKIIVAETVEPVGPPEGGGN